MKKILFVCLGNICRSPAAEGIFEKMVSDSGLSEKFYIDSAGTSAFHAGDSADPRMSEHSLRRGYTLKSKSRQFVVGDFNNFDLILTMDESNYENVIDLATSPESHSKVKKMTSYCRVHDVLEVPDPYYQGSIGFELVLDILEDACGELLKELR